MSVGWDFSAPALSREAARRFPGVTHSPEGLSVRFGEDAEAFLELGARIRTVVFHLLLLFIDVFLDAVGHAGRCCSQVRRKSRLGVLGPMFAGGLDVVDGRLGRAVCPGMLAQRALR